MRTVAPGSRRRVMEKDVSLAPPHFEGVKHKNLKTRERQGINLRFTFILGTLGPKQIIGYIIDPHYIS